MGGIGTIPNFFNFWKDQNNKITNIPVKKSVNILRSYVY